MDLKELESTLTLLTKYNVKRYLAGGVEIELNPQEHPTSPRPLDTKDHFVPAPEDHLPPDLKADDLFNYDKVLNWSGTPDNEAEMPLTGDI